MRRFYNWIIKNIDWFNSTIQKESISRFHIFFMFAGLGLFLVILPLAHLIVVSAGLELELGNYTNIISAGVSLLTLAEAVKISNQQNTHRDHLHDKINDATKKLDQIHEHLGIESTNDIRSDSDQNLDEPEF